MLHQWIETICDPSSNIIQELNKSVEVEKLFEKSHLKCKPNH